MDSGANFFLHRNSFEPTLIEGEGSWKTNVQLQLTLSASQQECISRLNDKMFTRSDNDFQILSWQRKQHEMNKQDLLSFNFKNFVKLNSKFVVG